MFHKGTAGHHDSVDANATNTGFTSRYVCKLNKKLQFAGPLHIVLASQPKLLISGFNVRIKLEKNKHFFALLVANDHYRIKTGSTSLYVKKVNLAASILLMLQKAFSMGVVKMPIRRVEIETCAFERFAVEHHIERVHRSVAFSNDIRVISNAECNGNVSKNLFKISNYDLNYLCTLNGGQMLPSKPYQPILLDDMDATSYLSLFLKSSHQSDSALPYPMLIQWH